MLLAISAAALGLAHTLLGPDHYLPFVVLSQAEKWSRVKTISITFFCGLEHILGSIVIGIMGLIFGMTLAHLKWLEYARGEVAAWLLIAFGLAYFIWGLRRGLGNRSHEHFHFHSHTPNLSPWSLFVIFAFNPCEPLIPLLIYPAAQASLIGILWVVAVFSFFTIATMLVMVTIFSFGFTGRLLSPLGKFSPAFGGGIICLTGLTALFRAL